MKDFTTMPTKRHSFDIAITRQQSRYYSFTHHGVKGTLLRTPITSPSIALNERAGRDLTGDTFMVEVAPDSVTLTDGGGLCAGIVQLVDIISMRRVAVLTVKQTTCQLRFAVGIGAIPYGGSVRNAVCLGYNALRVGRYASSSCLPATSTVNWPDPASREDRLIVPSALPRSGSTGWPRTPILK